MHFVNDLCKIYSSPVPSSKRPLGTFRSPQFAKLSANSTPHSWAPGILLLSGADCSFIKSPTERRKTALKTALKEKYDKIFRRTSERCILGNVQEFKSFLAVAIQGCKWVRDAAMPPLSTSEPELFSLPPTSNQQTPLLSQCGPRSKSKTHK